MANLQDVARMAGVSKGAASRVLNGPRTGICVSEATRKRILDAAAALDYRPDVNARRLVTGRKECIGVVHQLPSYLVNPYINATLDGIVTEAALLGFNVIIGSPVAADGPVRIPFVHDRAVDGIILSSVANPEAIAYATASGIPVVAVNPGAPGAGLVVSCDDRGGVRAALDHLLGHGHRAVGYAADLDWHMSQAVRMAAYREWMEDHGFEPILLPASVNDFSRSRDCAFDRSLAAAMDAGMTALLLYHDYQVFNVLDACRRAGVSVPGALSIVGINDSDDCLKTDPRLTSVGVPFRDMGRAAMALLNRAIHSPSLSGEAVTLPEALVSRESVAAPRAASAGVPFSGSLLEPATAARSSLQSVGGAA